MGCSLSSICASALSVCVLSRLITTIYWAEATLRYDEIQIPQIYKCRYISKHIYPPPPPPCRCNAKSFDKQQQHHSLQFMSPLGALPQSQSQSQPQSQTQSQSLLPLIHLSTISGAVSLSLSPSSLPQRLNSFKLLNCSLSVFSSLCLSFSLTQTHSESFKNFHNPPQGATGQLKFCLYLNPSPSYSFFMPLLLSLCL